ncbi:MAG: DUF1800 domain-containing protein [Pseudomonadota bacterium]
MRLHILTGLSWLGAVVSCCALGQVGEPLFTDGFERTGQASPQASASQFLHRATFGPTMAEIDRVVAMGEAAWINEQLALPVSWTRPGLAPLAERNYQECLQDGDTDCDRYVDPLDRQNIWWQTVIAAPDQLRHRVAFALSQLFVVSDRNGELIDFAEAMAAYYDLLLTHSFGNYRDLLGDVTRSPVMGIYLTHIRNRKAVPALNIRPDENYAREVMQLFTIGLNQLNPDGTLILDDAGQPLVTYTQADIAGMARVFTGWTFADVSCEDFEYDDAGDLVSPMQACEDYHDTDAKVIIDGVTLPGGQTAAADLNAALDVLFTHPNVGPFVSRRLIQRLVTSNPTPAYIQRVAAVFADNGSGVRGDLGAVVKAILLDPEAAAGTSGNVAFGKLREPLLRLSNLWRTFDGRSEVGEYYDYQPTMAGQAVLSAPSVFNFFLPDYQPAGLRGSQPRLVAPEFQLASDDKLTFNQNSIDLNARYFIDGAPWVEAEDEEAEVEFGPRTVLLHPAAELALASNPEVLLNRLDLLLLAGTMSTELRQNVRARLQQIPPAYPYVRVGEAIAHVMTSPEYLIQR